MKTNRIPWRLALPAVAVAALGVLVAVGPARAQNAAGQATSAPGTVSWQCPRTGQTVTVPATARQAAWMQGAGPGWGRGQGWGRGYGRGYGRGMMGW